MTKITILGAGESGVGAAILATRQGYGVFVSDAGRITDKNKAVLDAIAIEYEEGRHSEGRILGADEVMKSPGIPEKNGMVARIRERGIPVISEIELAYRHKGEGKIVGITGSNGKTTTTSMTYHICRHGGLDCALVGNIGVSFARQVAEDPKPLYIAEISSFQLDDIREFRPDIAILTNITEDHLDRYDYQFANYIRSKFSIVKNQQEKDYFIYCIDDPVISKFIPAYPFKSNP